MDNLETKITKRVQEIPFDLFYDSVEILEKYNVNFYNEFGNFDFNKFRVDCQNIMNTLFKNDKPINGIKYQLCEFMKTVQMLVGLRDMSEFIYDNPNISYHIILR